MLTQVHREEDESVVHISNYTQLFDVHPLTSVNLDTYIQVTDLRLVQGDTYQVVIIAVDESGGCVETSGSVTVDTTSPLGSQISVGPESDMVSLLYYSHGFSYFYFFNIFSHQLMMSTCCPHDYIPNGSSC